MSESPEFIEVKKLRITCPVCGKPDWCGISEDRQVVVCMRVESGSPTRNGGWLHRLNDPVPAPRHVRRPTPRPKPDRDWHALACRCANDGIPKLRHLASRLGVTAASLMRLQAGWYEPMQAYTFPMRDADDNVIGIRLRKDDGSKLCIPGSKTGLFWPFGVDQADDQPLYLVEGPTDCAALLDMGLAALGRPSCTGGVDLLVQWLGRQRRDVVIIADNDLPKDLPGGRRSPGIAGARALAEAVRPLCRGLTIIKTPGAYKDVRAWANAGAGAEQIVNLVHQAGAWR